MPNAPTINPARLTAAAHRRTIQPLEAARDPDALLTIATAVALTGLSVPTIYRKAAGDPDFPPLIKLGRRCTRVRAGALRAWLEKQGSAA
jgi:predicted DNA-binding transcriptional regulator AlpA